MALVTIALPCPPPPEPLSPLTSAPSKHNSETVGGWVDGWVGGSVQSGHYPQQRPGVPVCLRGVILVESLFWLLENKHEAQADSNAGFDFYLVGKSSKCPPLLPSFSYPTGSASMSGIYQGLPRWVQACLCSPGMALYNLRNVDDGWLACPWWAREMDSVCYKWYTHTHTRPTPTFISSAR